MLIVDDFFGLDMLKWWFVGWIGWVCVNCVKVVFNCCDVVLFLLSLIGDEVGLIGYVNL